METGGVGHSAGVGVSPTSGRLIHTFENSIGGYVKC
jgi:hypothetical protein